MIKARLKISGDWRTQPGVRSWLRVRSYISTAARTASHHHRDPRRNHRKPLSTNKHQNGLNSYIRTPIEQTIAVRSHQVADGSGSPDGPDFLVK
jgi:hypothetical protein